MQFSSVLIATALVASVAAFDYRETYEFNAGAGKPCDQFETACKNYKKEGLHYGASVCEAGNAQGLYKKSEAQVYCRFNDSTNKNYSYITDEVATSIGGHRV